MSNPEQLPRCPIGKADHAAANREGKAWSLRVCATHFDRLGKMLHEIETEVADLDAVPSIAIRWNTSGGGNSGGGAPAFQQTPVRLDALAHTDGRRGDVTQSAYSWNDGLARDDTLSAVDILNEWADRARTERGLRPPTITMHLAWRSHASQPTCERPCGHESCGFWITDEILALPDLHTDRVLLSRQLEWICEQSWAGDFYRAMRKLLTQLQRANGTEPPEPLGRCPAQPDPGKECGGALWPVKPTHTVGEWTGHAPSAVRCASCGTRWEGGREIALLWMTLERARKEGEA